MHGKMDCSGLSDAGRVREVNDDQYLIASLSKSMQVHQTSLDLDDQTRLFGASQGKLLLVADGVGNSASSRRASTLAVNSLRPRPAPSSHLPRPSPCQVFACASAS